ncbi:MAG: hypothetical protein AB2L12_08200 [Smithellaceae bacterium]
MAKHYVPESQNEIAYECLQLGFYRVYCDTRIETIMNGKTEVVKEIIAKAVLK